MNCAVGRGRACEGKPLNVRVYTAGDEVKLLLNGKEIGSKPVPESAKLLRIPCALHAGRIARGRLQGRKANRLPDAEDGGQSRRGFG